MVSANKYTDFSELELNFLNRVGEAEKRKMNLFGLEVSKRPRKKKEKSNLTLTNYPEIMNEPIKNYSEIEACKAISALKENYPGEIVMYVEKIFRLETRNFTSLQYKVCGTAGMEVGAWKNGKVMILPIISMVDNHTKGLRNFYVWNPFDFAPFLADYILRHGAARWNSTDLKRQTEYVCKLNSIQTKFV